MTPELSIIVPAYNEEKRINKTLNDLVEEFPGQELIVVCDGCTDATTAIVKQFPSVKSIVSDRAEGKGAAILKGFRQANGTVIGFLDADGSFSPSNVKHLLSHLDAGVDCVIASKWVGKKFSEVGETTTRKIVGRIWNTLIKALLRLDFADTQAGAKFVKRAVFERIDRDFISSGFEFDIELLYKINSGGFKVKEVYIPFTDVRDSTFSYRKTPSMLMSLIRLWFNSGTS
jgi:dolichol-phosphate mannosyltransferase